MTNKTLASDNNIQEKNKILEQAVRQLKKEFIGIDHVIDHLVQTVSCWYCFPDLQERPVIINLWGMTGVGKTSLVNRLVQLLGYENRFYRFDLGVNSDSASSIKSHLKRLFRYSDGQPAIIALDEFQQARTLDAMGNELGKYYSRVIWELLDSGRFQSTRQESGIGMLHKLQERVRFFVAHGVKVSRGKVTANIHFFQEMMEMGNYNYNDPEVCFCLDEEPDMEDCIPKPPKKKKDDPVWFLPRETPKMLFSLSGGKFNNIYEVTEYLYSLDETGILQFLEEVLEYVNSRKIVDCSKSLIIVMGNLDSAYTMGGNFNPDISADEFYEMSLKIKLPDIKRALTRLFRKEQIARLGNNHIIYPAFSSSSYRQLILLELNGIALKVKERFGWLLTFTESMRELIYREGIFPTQGTRPLFSTIQQLVHSRIARVAREAALLELSVDTVQFDYPKEKIVVRYYKKNKILHEFKEEPSLNLEKLRKPKRDDAQALTAVHESGHAVLSFMLMKEVPECIYSSTLEAEAAGYVLIKSSRSFLSRQDLLKQVAVYLGGLAAEELVFGRANITTGSSNDLEKATALAVAAIKEYGMGVRPAAIQAEDAFHNLYVHDVDHEHNNEAKQLLQDAHQLAENCLKENEALLLRMADYLSEERVMQKNAILQLLQKNSKVNRNYFAENKDLLFYRKHLKEKVAALKEAEEQAGNSSSTPFSMNKCV